MAAILAVLVGVGGTSCRGATSLPDAGDSSVDRKDAGGNLPVLGPSEMFGDDLRLWLDANEPSTIVLDGDGGVAEWNSRVVAGRRLSSWFPLLPYNGVVVDPVAANGKPAILVGPTRGMLASDDFTLASSVNWIISVVASYRNPVNQPGWFLLLEDSTEYPRVGYLLGNAKGRSVVRAGVVFAYIESAEEGWNDGALHAFSLCGQSLRVDGHEWSEVVGTWGADGWGRPRIGGQPSAGPDGGVGPIVGALYGAVAEVIVVVRQPCTPNTIAQLDAYYKSKYGLSF